MSETIEDSTQQEEKRKPGTFKPGQSGNPGGRNRTPVEVREAFQLASKGAVEYLIALMNDEKKSDTYRLKAADIILERAYGKPIPMNAEVPLDSSPLKITFADEPDPELLDPSKQDNLEMSD